MSTYSYGQLESIWLEAAQGTKYETQQWASLMAAIAIAESSGVSDRTNPTDNGGTQTSWGLWQISLGNHNAPSPNWADPVTNAKLAIGKLETQGLGAWGTYKNHLYHLQNVPAQPVSLSHVPNAPNQPGTPTSPGGSGILSWPSEITSFFSSANGFVNKLMWLVEPGSWVRIIAFIAGIALLLFAIHAFISVNNDEPIVKTPSAIPVPVPL